VSRKGTEDETKTLKTKSEEKNLKSDWGSDIHSSQNPEDERPKSVKLKREMIESDEDDKEEEKEKGKENEDEDVEEEQQEERSIFSYGGLRSIDPLTGAEEILFIGIIDNLTNYNFSKKLANLFKSALWANDELSTVPSKFYADRFTCFMTKNLLEDEETISMESDEEKDFMEYYKKHQNSLEEANNIPVNSETSPVPSGGNPPKKQTKKPVLDIAQVEIAKRSGKTSVSPRAATERPRNRSTERSKTPTTSWPRVQSDLAVVVGNASMSKTTDNQNDMSGDSAISTTTKTATRAATEKSPTKPKRQRAHHRRSGSDAPGRLSMPLVDSVQTSAKKRRSVAITPRNENEKKLSS